MYWLSHGQERDTGYITRGVPLGGYHIVSCQLSISTIIGTTHFTKRFGTFTEKVSHECWLMQAWKALRVHRATFFHLLQSIAQDSDL